MSGVIVAMDSFKGSLRSVEANAAVLDGLVKAGFNAEDILCVPVSDGGEGFCEVIEMLVDAARESVLIHSADGRSAFESHFMMDSDGTAYIESALACGYDRNPGHTPFRYSSFGLGELVREAASRKPAKIVVGLGGTCTNDAGVGLLQALGVKFYMGDALLPDGVPALMLPISSIDARALDGWSVPLEVWADTRAVFCGEHGATRVFGLQKGLTEDELDGVDAWMSYMATLYWKGLGPAQSYELAGITRDSVMERCIQNPGEAGSIEDFGEAGGVEGSGAAGGIGGALHAFLGAGIRWGAEEIVRLSSLRENMSLLSPAMVITGEGRFDGQTQTGKLPAWISLVAKESAPGSVRVCVCGSAEVTQSSLFDAVIPVTPPGMPLNEAMDKNVARGNIINALSEATSSKFWHSLRFCPNFVIDRKLSKLRRFAVKRENTNAK